jgi:hypothetical protein
VELIKYREGTEAAYDGLHLPGLDEQDTETLCGHTWSGFAYETIDGAAPTCAGCISIAKELFIRRGYTKKQVKGW